MLTIQDTSCWHKQDGIVNGAQTASAAESVKRTLNGHLPDGHSPLSLWVLTWRAGREFTLPLWSGSLEGVWALKAELELESGSSGPRPAFPQLYPHHRGTAASHGPESLSDCLLVPPGTPNSSLVKEAGPNSLFPRCTGPELLPWGAECAVWALASLQPQLLVRSSSQHCTGGSCPAGRGSEPESSELVPMISRSSCVGFHVVKGPGDLGGVMLLACGARGQGGGIGTPVPLRLPLAEYWAPPHAVSFVCLFSEAVLGRGDGSRG
ncbi:uncharacterized protein LOC133059969 [Dama dama]|uniref:uncharacterized protein LOC133059969 n=1 Tax=Dama dama TaxID=30532 RepID=UPI002A36A602|nr:uncharacterized protein LOC133059969 [Dama dama]